METVRTDLPSLLDIRPGVTAFIGGGGKTTLIEYLASRLSGTVLLCTTTRIWPPVRFPLVTAGGAASVRAAFAENRAVCLGTPTPEGKLSAPGLPMAILAELVDYVLVEADGAKGLPLKAHAPWEPVVPAEAGQTVLVLGLDGLGRPVRAACHRPERYAVLAGTDTDAPVTPSMAARVLLAEGYGDRLYLNKAESTEAARNAEALARLAQLPAVYGSLRREEFHRIM